MTTNRPPATHVDRPGPNDRAILYPAALTRHGGDPVYHLPLHLRSLAWFDENGYTSPSGYDTLTLCGRTSPTDPLGLNPIHLPLWAAVRVARLCRPCQNIAGVLVVEEPPTDRDVVTISTGGRL